MVNLDITIDEALSAQPRLASLFVRHRMICVGCGIARFHTLREAAEVYELDPDEFRREMEQVLAGEKSSPAPAPEASGGNGTPGGGTDARGRRPARP